MKKRIELVVFLVLLAAAIYLGGKKLAVFYCNRGSDYYNRGLYNEAVASYKKSININPASAIAHNSLAHAYVEAHMEDKAIEEFQKALYIDPHLVSAYLGLGKVYWGRQMYQEALDLLKEAQAGGGDNQEIEKLFNSISFEYSVSFLDKGVTAFLEGDKLKTHVLLHNALSVRPDFAYTYYTLAFFYFADNKYDEAEANLNKATQADPRFWPAYKLLGDICIEKGDYEEAINKYSLASDINSNDAFLRNDLGMALMQIERYKEAVAYLKIAVKLDPSSFIMRYNLANVLRDAHMFDEAVVEYERIIEQQPEYPNVHNELAVCYSRQARDKDAQREFRSEIDNSFKKLSQKPGNVVALNSLAFAYNGIGEPDKAKEAIKKAISIQPNYREAYFTLAEIQDKAGDKNGAVASLTKAKSLTKQADFIDKEIARLKREVGKLVKAKAVFNPTDIIYLKAQ